MRPEKRHALTVAALETLLLAAERVERNHGRYDNPGHPDHGTPLDWNDWAALRIVCSEARHALAREGVKVEVHPCG